MIRNITHLDFPAYFTLVISGRLVDWQRFLCEFTNLQALKLFEFNEPLFESLKNLKNLRELDLVGKNQKIDLLLDLPEYLKELQILTLYRPAASEVNIYEVQKEISTRQISLVHSSYKWVL